MTKSRAQIFFKYIVFFLLAYGCATEPRKLPDEKQEAPRVENKTATPEIGTTNVEVERKKEPSLAELQKEALGRKKELKKAEIGPTVCEEVIEPSIEIPKTSLKEKVYCNSMFCSQFSTDEKVSYWVSIETTGKLLNDKTVKRKDNFHADKCPPTPDEKILEGTDFDLGHMHPAEDVRYSSEAMYLAGSMLNLVPQHRTFNRGIWAQIEKLVRNAEKLAKRVWIITGPVSMTDGEKVGGVRRPLRFFKAVLSEGANGKLSAYGYMATRDVKAKAKESRVSVDQIEAETGYDLFALLPDEIEKKLEAEK